MANKTRLFGYQIIAFELECWYLARYQVAKRALLPYGETLRLRCVTDWSPLGSPSQQLSGRPRVSKSTLITTMRTRKCSSFERQSSTPDWGDIEQSVSMEKLVKGLHHFRENIFRTQRELFERLSKGQQPDALFITCSDSRINPNLITHTKPGDIFILRNAGNIVPPHGAPNSGEEATIEFAVVGLGIKDIIVCGHSHCGAVKGLLEPETLKDMPAVATWLSHAEAARRIAKEKYGHLSPEALQTAAAQENVLVQLENLRTLPVVAAALARGDLKLHGWMYKIQTGDVFMYDSRKGQFVPIKPRSTPDQVVGTAPADNTSEPNLKRI